jgi:hypothetical protein
MGDMTPPACPCHWVVVVLSTGQLAARCHHWCTAPYTHWWSQQLWSGHPSGQPQAPWCDVGHLGRRGLALAANPLCMWRQLAARVVPGLLLLLLGVQMFDSRWLTAGVWDRQAWAACLQCNEHMTKVVVDSYTTTVSATRTGFAGAPVCMSSSGSGAGILLPMCPHRLRHMQPPCRLLALAVSGVTIVPSQLCACPTWVSPLRTAKPRSTLGRPVSTLCMRMARMLAGQLACQMVPSGVLVGPV